MDIAWHKRGRAALKHTDIVQQHEELKHLYMPHVVSAGVVQLQVHPSCKELPVSHECCDADAILGRQSLHTITSASGFQHIVLATQWCFRSPPFNTVLVLVPGGVEGFC